MKKRILSLLLCAVLLLSFACGLFACEKEENPAPVTPPPTTPEYDGSAEDVTTELSELSFTEAIGIFKDAIQNSTDISSTLGKFKVEAEIPENMLSKKGKTYVNLADGVISMVNKEEEYYFGFVDGALASVIRTEETDGKYESSSTGQYQPAEALGAVALLEEALLVAEEHFGLSQITEDDFVKGDDGFFYLTDSYTRTLVKALVNAAFCIQNELDPKDFANLSEDEKNTLSELADAIVSDSKPKLGFGMRMRKIQAVRFAIENMPMGEYTGGEYDSITVDLTVTLDSTRRSVEKASLDLALVSEKRGDIDLHLDFLGYYSDTDGEISYLGLNAEVSMTDAHVHTKETLNNDDVAVWGDRHFVLKLAFDSAFTATGGNLIELFYQNESTPKRLEYAEDAVLKNEEKDRFMTAKNYTQKFDIKMNRDENKIGRIPCDISKGSVRATFTGSYKYGNAANPAPLSDEVKNLLGIK